MAVRGMELPIHNQQQQVHQLRLRVQAQQQRLPVRQRPLQQVRRQQHQYKYGTRNTFFKTNTN
jgi:hypothetical protein